MTSPLDTMIKLRRKAEREARVGLEQALATRVAAGEHERRLVALERAARATLLRAEQGRAAGPVRAAQAQTQERHRAHLRAEVLRATRELERHRQGAQAAALAAEEQARLAYETARVALAAAEKLALRAAAALAHRARRQAEDAASDHANAVHARRRNPG